MDILKNFLTRKQVREQTGWSLLFIDTHLPRVVVGHRKVLIPVDAVEQLLTRQAAERLGESTHPLFDSEATRRTLSLIFQVNEGSPHQLGTSEWHKFGEFLVDAFRLHVTETGLDREITTLDDVMSWQKSPQGREFFDRHIPAEFRPGLIVITDKPEAA